MRLLSRPNVERKLLNENNELISQNIRLRDFERAVTDRLNTIKDSYEPDKLAKLKDFEEFCQQILTRKAKLLEEVAGIEKLIEDKKDIFYGLVAKQDALSEKQYQIDEANKKLNLRETFVKDLEQRWRNRNS